MMIAIAIHKNHCTAYCQLSPDETPGAPEYNAIARHMRCEPEDMGYTAVTRIADGSDTNTQEEYDDWQTAVQAGDVLWRLRAYRHDRD
jgi:hypothetical protein